MSLGNQVLRYAESCGAQQTEVFLTSMKQIQMNVEKGSIKTTKEKHDVGCSIRVVIDNKLGYSYTSTLDYNDLRKRTQEAISFAKVSFPDEHFQSFPHSKETYQNVDGIFDPRLAHFTSEEAVELVLSGIEACQSHLAKKRTLIEAFLTVQTTKTTILNSLGITGCYQDTLLDFSVDPTIKEEDGQSSSFEFQRTRSMKRINPEWIGKHAAINTLSLLRPKSVQPGNLPVLFTPVAIDFLFRVGLADMFNAEEIQMERSYLRECLNQSIAPSHFTLRDDGLISQGNKSRPFDSEGYPSKTTEIIKKGELVSFYHNSYTANKANTENTGNAYRASYRDFLKIAPSNVIITPGKGSVDDLIKEMGKGIICRLTMDKPNIGTGELSALVMEGYYVDDGVIQHPVKNTLLGINMRDFFQKISLVGSDTRALYTTITPSIVIDSVKITSN